ncbi:hypothetical protein [Streptomyces sp. HPF1205]|uniref:hypothetical protein n=1 Tax=Streptomyces sp. HPF1205 TaxID=2873262 RepID=UPI001CED937A|nr:hypothetical protein [Streptomyces sp. HPF1205]
MTDSKPAQPMPLATSRYQNWRPEHGIPIGITVGRPRFVRYEFLRVSSLAPHELFKPPYKDIDDIPVERQVYRERLVTHREEILADLTAIAQAHPDQTGVLLCFEDVNKGEACHRRWAAKWFEEEYGWTVPELGTEPAKTADTTLF